MEMNRLHRFQKLERDVEESGLLIRAERIEVLETFAPDCAEFRVLSERAGDLAQGGGGGILRRGLAVRGAGVAVVIEAFAAARHPAHLLVRLDAGGTPLLARIDGLFSIKLNILL